MMSERFGREVVLTHHAKQRMAQHGVSIVELAELIENGRIHFKDSSRVWISVHLNHRDDDLVAVAAVIEHHLIIKTVMTLWEPLP